MCFSSKALRSCDRSAIPFRRADGFTAGWLSCRRGLLPPEFIGSSLEIDLGNAKKVISLSKNLYFVEYLSDIFI
jgi:hypothetical protein